MERSVYFRLNDLLPKGVYISDEINRFLNERLQDLEREKDSNLPVKGPIKIYENLEAKNRIILQKSEEFKIGFYSSQSDLVAYVQKIEHSKDAWALKRNAKLLCQLADTKAKSLQMENK